MGKSSAPCPSRVKRKRNIKKSKSKKIYWSNRKESENLNNVLHDHIYTSIDERKYVNPSDKSKDDIHDHSITAETVEVPTVCGNDKDQTQDESMVLEEFSFISQDEYNRIMEHQVATETEKKADTLPLENENRIVDIGHLLNWSMKLQYEHSKTCSVGKMIVISEQLKGLVSYLTFQCDFCGYTTQHSTQKNEDLNVRAVWTTISTGNTFSNLREKLSVMEIPPIPYSLFHKIEMDLGEKWEATLWDSIESAGKEEYDIAFNNDQIDEEGNVWITVYTDCGWSYRSYGHSYNAAAGVAVIIGKSTGKLLFLGVRNKYCSVCARSHKKEIAPPTHACFKNWDKSSGAMEADIIAEGFKSSLQMHNVKYLKFIADGDSTVYSKIKKEVPYGHLVQKIHCTNHAVKNYGKALYKIKADTSVSKEARKVLTIDSIKKLEQIAMRVLYTNAHGDLATLKRDLENGPNHVFEDHAKCNESYCDKVGEVENSKIPILHKTGLFHHINSALDRLIVKGDQLIDNETNNRAELFMSILCRFNAGKRLNLTQRGSFTIRAHLTGLRYNDGIAWQSKSWKKIMERSPGKNFKKFLAQKERAQELTCKRRLQYEHDSQQPHRPKKIRKSTENKENEYGPTIEEVVLTPANYNLEKERILAKLQVTEEIARNIEVQTKGQWDNKLFKAIRKNRLTASNFGEVCRRRATTPCHALVNKILYGPENIRSDAIEYGKIKEKVAVELFKNSRPRAKVENCGIFLDTDYGFLGASPDGLVGSNGILEVKCLYSVHMSGLTLQQAVRDERLSKNLCVYLNENNKIVLRRTHKYYYQIQGQLNISKKDICFFVLYINDNQPLHVEAIVRDKNFWRTTMVPKLINFYYQCVILEIILRRIPRRLQALDPKFIPEDN